MRKHHPFHKKKSSQKQNLLGPAIQAQSAKALNCPGMIHTNEGIDWRNLVSASRKEPGNLQLRQAALRKLWELRKFREVLEFLPPIQVENLEQLLKLHSQTLFRISIESTSYVKRLIPLTIAYCAFLGSPESRALLNFLEELVSSRENPSLNSYFRLSLRVFEEVRAVFLNEQGLIEPILLLNPEVCHRLSDSQYRERIFKYLEAAKSPNAIYYSPGGHYLLLAAGNYFSDIEVRDRKAITSNLNFRLDVLNSIGNPKKLLNKMKPFYPFMSDSLWAQDFIGDLIQEHLLQLMNQKGSESLAKKTLEIPEFVDFLQDFILNQERLGLDIHPNFDFTYVLCQFSNPQLDSGKHALSKMSLTLRKAKATAGAIQFGKWGIDFDQIYHQFQSRFVLYCIEKRDAESLMKFLSDTFVKKPTGRIRSICLNAADFFIEGAQYYRMNEREIIDSTAFFMKILPLFGPQKKRMKVLKDMSKPLSLKKPRR